jgi:hypothetical protein
VATAPVESGGAHRAPKPAESPENTGSAPVVNNQPPGSAKPLNGKPGKGRKP